MNQVIPLSTEKEGRPQVAASGAHRFESERTEADHGDTVRPVVLVLIRARDEERFIASVVLTARRYARHVVVVDDASSDRTADLAEAAGATVVRLSHRDGSASAIAAGFEVARRARPDFVICFDGDSLRDPSEALYLVQPILDGVADVVIGSRGATVNHGAATEGATSVSLPSCWSDGRRGSRPPACHVYSATAVDVLHDVVKGSSSAPDVAATVDASPLRVTEVSLRVGRKGPHGSIASIAPASPRPTIERMLHVLTHQRPLLLVGMPGVLLIVIGLLLGVSVSYHLGQVGELMVGTAILTVLLIVGGMVLSVTGVMLHSLEHFVSRWREAMSDVTLARRVVR